MNYRNLLLMTMISFISMFILMFVMVDSYINVYINLNHLYMTGTMIFSMLIIEIVVMRTMYPNKKFNALILALSTIALIVLTMFIRKQTAISDKEFLKSMIPHHAAAILMCKEASLQDPEIEKLCKNIISTQQSEIDFMKAKLEAMK